MSAMERHGLAPVARLDDLPPLEETLICCLRLYYDSDGARETLERALRQNLGADRGSALFMQFAELLDAMLRFARRPLMRRHAGCCAAGADENAFAAMVAAAATGDREDAMLIAVCMVRPDVSPQIVGLAEQVGLSLAPMVARVSGRNARRLN